MKALSSNAGKFETRPSDPRLAQCLHQFPPAVFSERLYQSIELMERYSIELAVDLSRQLNLVDQLGGWRSADELCGVLSFQPRFKFALRWMLERLVESGRAEARNNGESRCYRLRRRHGPRRRDSLRHPGCAAVDDRIHRTPDRPAKNRTGYI